MDIAHAKQQIKDAVDDYLTRDDTGAYLIPTVGQRPIFLLGAPGIGKTAIINQVAHELGIGVVSYSMTHHTRQSALGLPFIVHRSYEGEEFDVSEYTMSEIIASVYDYQEKTGLTRGILFLDEINCVSETLYPSMLQFLQSKTFGRHKVPDGWIVVCAGNPPEYNKSVYDFDVVTLDRLRRVVVEPDLDAWMTYALATGVHPSIISFLEVKRDNFYSVESTPEGKSFVTARGWDDLSRIIQVAERKGKRIDKDIVSQFIQDEEIAERFSQYYALFTKYRSDYQIGSILAGEATDKIYRRAQDARFDERLALTRLILDAIDSDLEQTLDKELVVALLRDTLRDVKQVIIDGKPAPEVLRLIARETAVASKKRVDTGTSTNKREHAVRKVIELLGAYASACEQARVTAGPEAFAVISDAYSNDVAELRAMVDASQGKLAHAFAFMDAAYGDGKEMAAFMAELAARSYTSQFIAKFGCDAYYAHSTQAKAHARQSDLMERIESFDLEAAAQAQAAADAADAACSCGGGCSSGCC